MIPAVRSKRELAIVFSSELPKYFTKQEIDLILDTCKDNPKKFLLLNLLWQTGVRISEALNIRVKDIDFHARALKVVTLKQKNKPVRVIPLQGGLLGLMGAYIAANELKRDDKLFDFTRQRAFQIVKEAVIKAGFDVERAHPHVFRHSFAVHAILSGVPVLVVKEWLGHANIQNTFVYLQVLGKDTRKFYEELVF